MRTRQRKLLVVIAAGVVVLALTIGLYLRHRAAVERARVAEAAWSTLAVELQRRENLVSPLVTIFQAKEKRDANLILAVTEAQTHCKTALGHVQAEENAAARVRLETGVAKCEEELGRNLSHLMAQSAKYPDLTANKTFQIFGEQLKSLEARITAARTRFDAAASRL